MLPKNRTTTATNTALFEAIERGDDEAFKAALAKGDVSAPDTYGLTPLLAAVADKHDRFIKPLLEAGADINEINTQDGCNALWYATENDDTSLFDELLKMGVSPEFTDSYGEDILLDIVSSSMISKNNLSMFLSSLKEAGVDMNKVYEDKDGNTPLTYAIQEGGNLYSVEALIANGADPKVIVDGLSCIQIALIAGNRDMARFLASKGAAMSLEDVLVIFDKLNLFEE